MSARDVDILAEDKDLCDLGFSPAESLKPFEKILNYQVEKVVNVNGYSGAAESASCFATTR